MPWKNKRNKKSFTKYSNYSIIKKLKSEEKINDNTLNNINNISLEDLIAIKLENILSTLTVIWFVIPFFIFVLSFFVNSWPLTRLWSWYKTYKFSFSHYVLL